MTGVIEGAADMGGNYVNLFTVLPVPHGAPLFLVAGIAQAVFKFLHTDHGVSRYKLDPLFEIYPKLF